MSNNQNVSNFNKYARDFLTVMKSKITTEKIPIKDDPIKKIDGYLITFTLCETMDPKSPVNLFMSSVDGLGLQIMSMDEQFFKSEQYVGNAESFSGQIGLVECWDCLSADTKALIWKYMQTLFITGMGAVGKIDELQKIMKEVKMNKEKEIDNK